MGPRPDGRGRPDTLSMIEPERKRQWGRGRMAAEGSQAETAFSACLWRQWGRGRMAAEGDRAEHVDGPQQASMGPRPDGRGRKRGAKGGAAMVLASMGPRPDGRGRIGHVPAVDSEHQASMGPRPDGRGRIVPPAWSSNHGMRQWGRGRMAAEGRRFQTPRRQPERRQWGRGRMAAEGRLARRQALVRDLASMGPRPDGRGRLATCSSTPSTTTSVNGAAAGWPRKAGSVGGSYLGLSRQWGRGRMAAEGRRSVIWGEALR